MKIIVLSEEEAGQVAVGLARAGAQATVSAQQDEDVRGLVPLFVWIVGTAIVGVAGLAEVIRRWMAANGPSTVITVDDDGEVQVKQLVHPKGFVIVKQKDGQLVWVRSSVLDLEDLLKSLAEHGLGAAAEKAKESGGTSEDPTKDEEADDQAPDPA